MRTMLVCVRRTAFPLLITAVLGIAACTAGDPEEDVMSDEGELRQLPASSILGTIADGETKEVVVATASYRALAFDGAAEENVSATIESSVARLDGLWIVDDKFANVGVALAQPNTAKLSVSAKLTKTGKHYVVFRQRVQSSITHKISLTKNAAAPAVGLTPGKVIRTDQDGFARVSFPGRAGDRFRIVLGYIDGRFGAPSAVLEGCATKELAFDRSNYMGRYGTTDVTITTTGTCTIKAGNAVLGPNGGVYMALMRLGDPEREAYVKSLECEGPELPLSALAAAFPSGGQTLWMGPRDNQRGRKRTCHPATGCSPYEPLVARTAATGYSYSIKTTDQGLELGVVDEKGFGYTLPASSGNNIGARVMRYTTDNALVRVRVTKSCLSLVSEAPDQYGHDHVVRFDIPDAQRPPEVSPDLGGECGGTPLTDAEVLALFPAGSSQKVLTATSSKAERWCNLWTTCGAWGAPSAPYTGSMSLKIDGLGRVGVERSAGVIYPIKNGQIFTESNEPVGKITQGCIDLTTTSKPPAYGTPNRDGMFSQSRRREVGTF